MSKSRSKAGRNLRRYLCSTDAPDGFSHGRTYTKENDDTDTPKPHPEDEDRWSHFSNAIWQIRFHPLVREFGFPPDSLVTNVDSDHPVAMDLKTLAITLAACHAADDLADLAGDRKVCHVLGWIGEPPKSLKGFGINRLFRHADALRACVQEIKAERSQPKSNLRRDAPALSLSKGTPHSGGIRPRLSLPTRFRATPKGKNRP